jgi:mannose-6-phosphate isomerase-like protein (cupin superfamily)
MSTPQVAAQQLAGTALAPAGSQLVLAEWTAEGSTGDKPLYQAPLHEHSEDEAWYVLEGRWRSAQARTSTRYQPEAR